MTLLIERSHLVTLLRRLRLRKIDFGTFQLGIAQLVPRVSGSPSPLPAPKNREKKKKVPNPPPRPPSPPPIDWKSTGAIEKNIEESEKFPEATERVPAGHKTSRWPWTFSRAPVLALAVASARPAPPTRPAPCTKGQPIKTDLTAPLLTLANYLYIYLIRLLPHSSAPGYFVSLSPIGLSCPGVKPFSNPNPLLKKNWSH